MSVDPEIQKLQILLDRDLFLRTLIRELAGVLEDTVGVEEASGYVSLVGQNVGEWINEAYRRAMGVPALSLAQVADVLVDMKARIGADFEVVGHTDGKIVLDNPDCPFGDKVVDRPSMCMMTSNVFGLITAENLGYAKVVIEKSIAWGDSRCRVIVYLRPSDEANAASGREYFRTEDNV